MRRPRHRRRPDVRLHAVVLEAEPGVAQAAVKSANAKLVDRQQVLHWSTWPEEDFPRTHTLKVKRNLVLDQVRNERPADAGPVQVVTDDQLIKIVLAIRKGDARLRSVHPR